LHEYEHLTLARLLLAQEGAAARPSKRRGTTSSSLVTVHTLLDRLHDAAAVAGRDGSLLEIRVLKALARRLGGEKGTALAVLGQALEATPEPETRVRLYLDEGAPMLDLLRHAAQAGDTAGQRRDRDHEDPEDEVGEDDQKEMLRAWARQMLERAESAPEGPPLQRPLANPLANPVADPLSQREIEVLRLLDSELSGPQIAGELYVSLNTLRTHTKRIFTKLGVTSRAAAVRTAHEHGLI
jgi:LuxR family maltose regulon positive regulatory protein